MADPTRIWTAALIVIGDEILSGRTQDKNISQIATWLNVQGIRLREARAIDAVLQTRASWLWSRALASDNRSTEFSCLVPH